MTTFFQGEYSMDATSLLLLQVELYLHDVLCYSLLPEQLIFQTSQQNEWKAQTS